METLSLKAPRDSLAKGLWPVGVGGGACWVLFLLSDTVCVSKIY